MGASVIVGYIVALLAGGAKGFAEKKVQQLLEQLYARVTARLGRHEAIERLAEAPEDLEAQKRAAAAIDVAAHVDPSFRAELATLSEQIRQHAPNLLIHAPGSEDVTGIDLRQTHGGVGDVRGAGNVITIYNAASDTEYAQRQLRTAPFAIKAMFVIGFALAIAGLGRFFYFVLFQASALRPTRGMPVAVQHAFGLFFLGFVVYVAAIAAATLRRRHA